jgi:Mor family transcriptional regulator
MSLNAQRNATIFKLWLRGWTYKRIADRYDLSVAMVNKIINAARYAPRKKQAA